MYVHTRNGFLTIRFRWCHFYNTLQLVFRFLTIEMPKYIEFTYLSTRLLSENDCVWRCFTSGCSGIMKFPFIIEQQHKNVLFEKKTTCKYLVLENYMQPLVPSTLSENHIAFFSRENLFLLLFTLIYISCIFCRIFIFILLTNAK